MLGYFVCWVNRIGAIDKVFCFMGGLSLESYLTNIYLPDLLRYVHLGALEYGNYLKYILVVLLGIPLAYCINRISANLVNRIAIRNRMLKSGNYC